MEKNIRLINDDKKKKKRFCKDYRKEIKNFKKKKEK